MAAQFIAGKTLRMKCATQWPASTIIQKKNELRDFPATITTGSFEGWNDLKAMWPTGSIPNIPRQWQL